MDIIMPKMGESINEGTIIKWHKSVGDTIKMDEIIFEISTDKVDTEIPSPVQGVLKEIKFNEGETVEVGTVVAVIDSNAEVVEEADVTITESSKEKDTSEDQKTNTPGDMIEIEMPKMGESVMEGTIIKWYKRVGDKVGRDEALFEISTDKVDTEVPSPVEGVIAEILIGEQETVDVGTIVAKIFTGKGTVIPPSKEIVKDEQTE
ncbi:MAG: 2-oxoglutarate dehydrogenase, partial [Ignavibacteriae bacterium]